MIATILTCIMLQQAPAAPMDEARTPAPPPPAPPTPSSGPPPSTEPPPVTPPPAETPAAEAAAAAEPPKPQPKLSLYGFAMLDTGFNFGTIDPDWFDVVRPTKLPSAPDEFGAGGHWFAGVRQTRFGEKSELPTPLGDFKTTFEFELFGVGDDAGQTTFRLRHAYGEIGQFGAGQTWSPFMDIDVFPNSIEYWGPNGMVFFRNVQVRWMPLKGPLSVVVALERPGASQDLGVHQSLIEEAGVTARYPLPDLSAHVRLEGDWGHLQVAGILRYMRWDDPTGGSLSGDAIGAGLHLSSNIKLGPAVFKLSAVYGQAIEAYMNDAGDDVATHVTTDPARPIAGVGLGVFGGVAFIDMKWADWATSSIGYSIVMVQNSDGQAPDAFRRGHYALANLLFHPLPDFMLGAEFQWGERVNNSDGFSYDDFRLQFSSKFSYERVFSKSP